MKYIKAVRKVGVVCTDDWVSAAVLVMAVTGIIARERGGGSFGECCILSGSSRPGEGVVVVGCVVVGIWMMFGWVVGWSLYGWLGQCQLKFGQRLVEGPIVYGFDLDRVWNDLTIGYWEKWEWRVKMIMKSRGTEAI